MFEPISARLASSFSRNGISEAATDTSCLGDTSIRSTDLARVQHEFAALAGGDQLVDEPALGVQLALAWATVWRISSVAER
jgi:hypothetical protein